MIRFIILLAICQGILAQSPYSRRQRSELNAQVRRLTDLWVPNDNVDEVQDYQTGLEDWDAEGRSSLPIAEPAIGDDEKPELMPSFDAREKWSKCASLKEIRDQGCCGSCWAVSSAEMITDRWCIHSKNNDQFRFSETDLLSCCTDCGSGCHGGFLGPALEYWVNNGVASGGPYQSNKGCLAYPFDICRFKGESHEAPPCSAQCQSNYNVTKVVNDKRFGHMAYRVPTTEKAMQRELYYFGPFVVGFQVYADFKEYKSGVYKHVTGEKIGGHAVKVLGWGEENGVKYWLVANSWGTKWGEGGYFKFLRGANHLGFESMPHAAIPDPIKHLRRN